MFGGERPSSHSHRSVRKHVGEFHEADAFLISMLEVPVYEILLKIDDTVQVSRDMNLFLAFLISRLLEITKP